MKESVTCQAILEEGRAEARAKEAQRILLSLGAILFGKPTAKVRRVLAQFTDRNVLEALLLRVVKVSSWAELLEDLR